MGLSRSREESSKPTFTLDVFRLDICGPEEDNLSIIDVPGIFKNTTHGLTTKQDMDLVKDMVLSYMRNPRSIMLTVIPANVDIATQEILEMARECDPEGSRTQGVFTKPDLVDKGAEDKVIDLVEGKTSSLKLGWIVVRNAGQQQLLDQDSNRDEVESQFFREAHPWNNLPKDKVGIASLKIRLQEVQTTQIRREFPKACHVIYYLIRRLWLTICADARRSWPKVEGNEAGSFCSWYRAKYPRAAEKLSTRHYSEVSKHCLAGYGNFVWHT